MVADQSLWQLWLGEQLPLGGSRGDQLQSQLQVIRNVELENALLRTELSLYQREENIKELELRNERSVKVGGDWSDLACWLPGMLAILWICPLYRGFSIIHTKYQKQLNGEVPYN